MIVVYRAFGAGGRLLYVGVTGDLERRRAEHRRDFWWPLAVGWTVVEYATRAAALAAERAAIRYEAPAFNRQGRPGSEQLALTTASGHQKPARSSRPGGPGNEHLTEESPQEAHG